MRVNDLARFIGAAAIVLLSAGVGLRFVHDLERGKETVELGRALRVAAAVGLRLEAKE